MSLAEPFSGRLALGTAQWTISLGISPSQAERLVGEAFDAGIRIFDTAHAYQSVDGHANGETLLGGALRKLSIQGELLVATKGGHYRDADGAFRNDGRPNSIRKNCDQSLRALGVDRIGLYFLHHTDADVPIEDSVGELSKLQEEGKIRMIGLSNASRADYVAASAVTRIAAVQNEFSVFAPSLLEELLQFDSHTAFMVFSTLGGAKRVRHIGDSFPSVRDIAAKYAVSENRIVLAWVLQCDPRIIAILGAARPETLRDSTRAPTLSLSPKEMASINKDVKSSGEPNDR